ncbi:MAG TPA: nuclear transport factor 2 family protein [Caldilineaceae bacterium]|nr:nuclear transport factor 2 family protein [Caldilineaceae bacterium]
MTGQTNTLAEYILNHFDRLWNEGREAELLDQFADDAVVTNYPPIDGSHGVYRGKAEIAQFVRNLLPGFHVESREFQENGDRVTWYSTVSNDGMRAMGIDSLDCVTEAVIRNGKIHSFNPTFTPESVAKMQAIAKQ